jgi:hypothetical protein
MVMVLRWILVGAAAGVALPAAAGDFDGSKKLICAPVQAMDCADGVDCVTGTPRALGAPEFIRVDFDAKQVIGARRATDIRLIDRSESQVLLQGFDEGLAWAIAISSETGRMYATMAGGDGAIILNGSCTPL